jgi:hypothetical protein
VRRIASLWILALAPLALAPALRGDWLVTRDGARIETRGPWKVEGRRVLFTQPNGTLSVIRAEEIDLERSALETQRALAAAASATAAAPAARPEPVMRLTERDLPPVPDAGAEEPEGAASAPDASAVSAGLEVISWDRAESPNGDGVELIGTVRNSGTANVTSPTLVVTLYDAEGKLVATAEGRVNAPAIPVGKTANFRAVFPGIVDFAAARFDAQGRAFATFPPGEGEEAGAGEGATAAVETAEPDEGEAAPVAEESVAEEPPPVD